MKLIYGFSILNNENVLELRGNKDIEQKKMWHFVRVDPIRDVIAPLGLRS